MVILNFLKGFFLAIIIITTFTACDNCANMACTNGTCKEGTCNCNTGYYLNNKNCVAYNSKYVGTGTATAQTTINGNPDADMPITLVASTTNPYNFTLTKFKNIIKNDLVFTVNSNDSNALVSLTNVTNSSGNSYHLSGSKSGSTVTLTIVEVGLGGATYVLRYGA